MPIDYYIDHTQKIIFESWTGPISADVLRRYWINYMADERVMALRRTVVDVTKAEILFKAGDLFSLVSGIVIPRLGDRDWRTAIVVSDPVQYGVSRQYHIFASSYSRDAIFFDVASAIEWINAPRAKDKP
jgi:hypothetical protein